MDDLIKEITMLIETYRIQEQEARIKRETLEQVLCKIKARYPDYNAPQLQLELSGHMPTTELLPLFTERPPVTATPKTTKTGVTTKVQLMDAIIRVLSEGKKVQLKDLRQAVGKMLGVDVPQTSLRAAIVCLRDDQKRIKSVDNGKYRLVGQISQKPEDSAL